MTKGNYLIGNIQSLLNDNEVSDEELRCLAYDLPCFISIYDRLSPGISKAELVRLLIDCADQKSELKTLLVWAKEHYRATYKKYRPYRSQAEKSDRTETVIINGNITGQIATGTNNLLIQIGHKDL